MKVKSRMNSNTSDNSTVSSEVNIDEEIVSLSKSFDFGALTSKTKAEEVLAKYENLREENYNAWLACINLEFKKVGEALEREKKQGKLPTSDFNIEMKSLEDGTIDPAPKTQRIWKHWFLEGYKALKYYYGNQFEIIAPMEGNTGGVMFGFKKEVFSGMERHGLRCPTKRFVPISDFTVAITEVIEYLKEDTAKYWSKIFSQSYGAEISNNLKHTRVPKEKSTTLSGSFDAWKVVPALEHFDERIQEIDPYELLSIFNKAEANTTLIHIGRAAAGVPHSPIQLQEMGSGGTRYPEKFVTKKGESKFFDFHYRSLLVHHGDAEIGKTTIWETFLLPAFVSAGYTFDVLPRSFNQFNWSGAKNDIYFCGDMSREGLINLQKSENIKSIAASEMFSDEKKGKDAVKSRARAAVVVICNEVGELTGKDKDRGVSNRFHLCQAKTGKQIATETGFSNLYQHWSELVEKYDTSFEVLSLYLIRRALDMFIKEAGYSLVNNDTYKFDRANQTITHTLTTNKEKYLYQSVPDLIGALTRMCRKALIINNKFHKLPDEFDRAFNSTHLLQFAGVMKNLQDKIAEAKTDKGLTKRLAFYNELIEWLNPSCFDKALWVRFYARMDMVISNEATKPASSFWDESIKFVETFSGHKPYDNRIAYGHSFKTAQQETASYEVELQAILDKHGEDESVLLAISCKFRGLG